MTYNLNGKNITIPNTDIAKSVKLLGLTEDEAVQMWLEDEGYLTNETVEELTAKAKTAKISHDAKSLTPQKPTTRERKPDEEKEGLIEKLSNFLKNEGYSVEITNKSKLIEFNCGENHYKLDLIKQRPPKK